MLQFGAILFCTEKSPLKIAYSKKLYVYFAGSGFSGRWWFSKKQRKSSSSPPSSVEGSPQPEGTSDSSPSPLSHSSGSDSTPNEVAAMIVASASERELTPASIQSAEFESNTEDDETTGGVAERSEVTPGTPTPPPGGEGAVRVVTPTDSPGGGGSLRDRQTSIVHASNLSTADHVSAARARAAASSKRRTRLGTDEDTNQTGEFGVGLSITAYSLSRRSLLSL